jgi:putative two-component system response regulator
LKILIAEDETVTRRRLQHFLEKWGHQVITSENGLEALEHFLSKEIDMVITDWMMPEMDGLELVGHIRSRGREKPYVYTILLTAKGDKEDVVKGLSEVGVDDYVVKPFEPDELRARLTVGERTLRLERTLREYGTGLEKIVQKQTRMIRQTQEETIIRLLTALESRDEETGGHVRRIGLYSAYLSEAAGWAKQQVDDIRLAAPMHDIGKIGVPDAILQKKGPLTTEEFEVIKSHTTIGGQILGNSEFPMLQLAHDIALFHHEKWEGKGYPENRSAKEIPEAARIVALVDVYDALSQDRVYRKADPEDEVLRKMDEAKGNHFDPYFYDLFLKSLPVFRKIASENP